MLGKIRLAHALSGESFSLTYGSYMRQAFWFVAQWGMDDAFLSQSSDWIFRRSHFLLDIVGQVAVNPLIDCSVVFERLNGIFHLCKFTDVRRV